MAVASQEGELSKTILNQFMETFQERNSNLHVFAAHMHMYDLNNGGVMPIPTYLQKYAVNIVENDPNSNGFTSLYIQPQKGKDMFDIYYYGEIENEHIIGAKPTFANVKIIAKSALDNEGILLFDATEYGYNGMFCEKHTEIEKINRPLIKFDTPPSKIKVSIGYGIDYESEKEDYAFDENGKVILVDDRRILWEELVCNGFDWVCISLVSKDGTEQEIVNEELA